MKNLKGKGKIMDNSAKKRNRVFSFLLGAIVGVLCMTAVVSGYSIYNAGTIRWGSNDPNSKIIEIFSLISQNSIHEPDLETMLDAMYRGFVSGLGDRYTMYLSATEVADFNERITGTFVGIGVNVINDPEDGIVTIVNVFRDAPAEEAGLQPGDKIIKIDGDDITDLILSDVISRITGPENTPVHITILRGDETFEVEIIRRRIMRPSVEHEMHETGAGPVGYIRIMGFDGSTVPQFERALSELIGMEALIIDLRNNGGGTLNDVNQITNRLIPEGVITSMADAQGRMIYHYSDEHYLGLPLIILVNGGSASASEILSGAVQDTGIGIIMGEQTFGKGTVQSVFTLSDGSAVQVTIRNYFTSGGTSIQDIGITPDIVVEMDPILAFRIGNISLEEDVQLLEALSVIAEMME